MGAGLAAPQAQFVTGMGMTPVLDVIARRYVASRAGRTGAGRRDLIFSFNDLLRDAGCLQGTARHEAIRELEGLESEGLLTPAAQFNGHGLAKEFDLTGNRFAEHHAQPLKSSFRAILLGACPP